MHHDKRGPGRQAGSHGGATTRDGRGWGAANETAVVGAARGRGVVISGPGGRALSLKPNPKTHRSSLSQGAGEGAGGLQGATTIPASIMPCGRRGDAGAA